MFWEKWATFGCNWSSSMFGGILAFLRARHVLTKAANPAAPSACPIAVLMLPIRRMLPSIGGMARLIASASAGSPAGVPVPCASKY